MGPARDEAAARGEAPPPYALEAREVVVRFGDFTALDRVSLQVRPGEIYYVMGGSGSGKTTLLRCLVRLLRPTSGTVLVEGRDVSHLGPAELAGLRRVTGMVFQGAALLSSVSLADNVALPLRAQLRLPPDVVDEVVRMKLAQVGLLEAADRMPSELSGGMQKRAGIARALALDPRLLFFDEPTSGLDPVTSAGIDELILELRGALGVTCVVVSHDLPSAARAADRLLVMHRGRALIEGTFEAVQASRDPAVRAFLDRRAEPLVTVAPVQDKEAA